MAERLSPDIVDALRLEISPLSPAKDREMRDMVTHMRNILVADFGQYMDPAILAKTEDVADRVLYLGYRPFVTAMHDWYRDDDGEIFAADPIAANMDGLLLISSRPKIWQVFSKEYQDKTIQQTGSRTKALRKLQADFLYTALAEELVHDHQSTLLHTLSVEFAAPYYISHILNALAKEHPIQDLAAWFRKQNTIAIDVFDVMLEEAVYDGNPNLPHRINFGTETDPQAINEYEYATTMLGGFTYQRAGL